MFITQIIILSGNRKHNEGRVTNIKAVRPVLNLCLCGIRLPACFKVISARDFYLLIHKSVFTLRDTVERYARDKRQLGKETQFSIRYVNVT